MYHFRVLVDCESIAGLVQQLPNPIYRYCYCHRLIMKEPFPSFPSLASWIEGDLDRFQLLNTYQPTNYKTRLQYLT
jgi:hypothetical protein